MSFARSISTVNQIKYYVKLKNNKWALLTLVNFDRENKTIELRENETEKIYTFRQAEFSKVAIKYKDLSINIGESIFNLTALIVPYVQNMICQRYLVMNKYYTNGGRTTFSLDSWKDTGIFNKKKLKDFGKNENLAHIYSTIDKNLEAVLALNENRTIIFKGISGSGKSVNFYQSLKYINHREVNQNKNEYFGDSVKILKLLDAFTAIKKGGNHWSASCCKYSQVGFGKHNQLTSFKIYPILINTSIVCQSSLKQTNFEIFYHFYSTYIAKYFPNLEIEPLTNYKSLNCRPIFSHLNQIESKTSAKIIQIFKDLNFLKNEIEGIYRILLAILNLANIDVKKISHSSDLEIDIEKDKNYQQCIKLLGLNPDFKNLILTKDLIIHNQPFKSNKYKCCVRKICEHLYKCTLDYIFFKINKNYYKENLDKKLNIFDFKGFVCSDENGFENLRINIFNELLECSCVQENSKRISTLSTEISAKYSTIEKSQNYHLANLTRKIYAGLCMQIEKSKKKGVKHFKETFSEYLSQVDHRSNYFIYIDQNDLVIKHYLQKTKYDINLLLDREETLNSDSICALQESSIEVVRDILCILDTIKRENIQNRFPMDACFTIDEYIKSVSPNGKDELNKFTYALCNKFNGKITHFNHTVVFLKSHGDHNEDYDKDFIIRQLEFSNINSLISKVNKYPIDVSKRRFRSRYITNFGEDSFCFDDSVNESIEKIINKKMKNGVNCRYTAKRILMTYSGFQKMESCRNKILKFYMNIIISQLKTAQAMDIFREHVSSVPQIKIECFDSSDSSIDEDFQQFDGRNLSLLDPNRSCSLYSSENSTNDQFDLFEGEFKHFERSDSLSTVASEKIRFDESIESPRISQINIFDSKQFDISAAKSIELLNIFINQNLKFKHHKTIDIAMQNSETSNRAMESKISTGSKTLVSNHEGKTGDRKKTQVSDHNTINTISHDGLFLNPTSIIKLDSKLSYSDVSSINQKKLLQNKVGSLSPRKARTAKLDSKYNYVDTINQLFEIIDHNNIKLPNNLETSVLKILNTPVETEKDHDIKKHARNSKIKKLEMSPRPNVTPKEKKSHQTNSLKKKISLYKITKLNEDITDSILNCLFSQRLRDLSEKYDRLYSSLLILMVHYFNFYAEPNVLGTFFDSFFKKFRLMISNDKFDVLQCIFYLEHLTQFHEMCLAYIEHIAINTINNEMKNHLSDFLDVVKKINIDFFNIIVTKFSYQLQPYIPFDYLNVKENYFFESALDDLVNTKSRSSPTGAIRHLESIVKSMEKGRMRSNFQDLILRRVYKNISQFILSTMVSFKIIREDWIKHMMSVIAKIFEWHVKITKCLSPITQMNDILEIQSLFKLSPNNISKNIKLIRDLPQNIALNIVSKACESEKPFKLKYEESFLLSIRSYFPNVDNYSTFVPQFVDATLLDVDLYTSSDPILFYIDKRILIMINNYSLDKY